MKGLLGGVGDWSGVGVLRFAQDDTSNKSHSNGRSKSRGKTKAKIRETAKLWSLVKSGKFQKMHQVVDRTENRVCAPGEGMRGVKLIF